MGEHAEADGLNDRVHRVEHPDGDAQPDERDGTREACAKGDQRQQREGCRCHVVRGATYHSAMSEYATRLSVNWIPKRTIGSMVHSSRAHVRAGIRWIRDPAC